MRIWHLALLLPLGGCAAAVDRALADRATDAFAAICLAPDPLQQRAEARRHNFRPIEGDAARALQEQGPGEFWARKAIGVDALVLREEPRRCEIGIGTAAPPEVSARFTEMLTRLARSGTTVTLLTETGSAEQLDRTYRVVGTNGPARIVRLRSMADL